MLCGLSLVAVMWGCSPVAVHGIHIAVPSFVAGHRLQGVQASVIAAHRLSCSAACGISSDQGLNLCPLHWQADSLPLHQGSLSRVFSQLFYKSQVHITHRLGFQVV